MDRMMTTTTKQLSVLLFTIITAAKLLTLPALYATYASRDAWFAALLNFLLDGALLAVLLVTVNKFDGETFYEVLERNLGRAMAKIVYFLYFIYFLFKAMVPVMEQKNYVEITLYETAPTVLTFLPFFFIAFYLCVKGLKTMSRLSEIIIWMTALGLGLALFLSFSDARPQYLLPILKNPLNLTLSAVYGAFIWYGQPLVILFLMGGIKRDRHFCRDVIITYAAAMIVCVLFIALFISIYGDFAPRQIYAVGRMTKYAIALANVGRFDYIATLLLNFSSVLALSVPLIFATECLRQVFGGKRMWLLSLIVNGIMFLSTVILHASFSAVIEAFAKYFTPAMLFFAYIMPLATLFMKRRKTDALLQK